MLPQTQVRVSPHELPARKGDTIGRGVDSEGRKYFWRKKSAMDIAGVPLHNIEVALQDGMLVNFTVIPPDMRELHNVKSAAPRAKVVRRGRKFGFLFGQATNPLYYPLDYSHDFEFTVYSMPMRRYVP